MLAIFGPTASGKTAVAEAVADALGGEVVSADSMQVYCGLPVLTNQPERPTRLVAVWPLEHEGSVAEYQQLAHAAIDELLAAGRTPVVARGTGLYLRAALADLGLPPAVGRSERRHWEQLYDRAGADDAHRLLRERDPEAAALVHPNDRRRVVRALELEAAGASLAPGRDMLWAEETRHPTATFGLDVPRETLAERIRVRAEAMFEHGVEDEVRRAIAGPMSPTARHALGLDAIATLPRAEAVEMLVARTRRYATYQRKWMRRIPGLVSVAADRPPDEVAADILQMARARQHVPRHVPAR